MSIPKIALSLLLGFVISTVGAQDRLPAAADPGRIVYEQNCVGCHQWDGSGESGQAPPLIKGMFVGGEKAVLIRILLDGMEGVDIHGVYYETTMPSFDYLSDQEIADVLTYLRSNFSNNASAIMPAEIANARKKK